jgi:hypothetical protein
MGCAVSSDNANRTGPSLHAVSPQPHKGPKVQALKTEWRQRPSAVAMIASAVSTLTSKKPGAVNSVQETNMQRRAEKSSRAGLQQHQPADKEAVENPLAGERTRDKALQSPSPPPSPSHSLLLPAVMVQPSATPSPTAAARHTPAAAATSALMLSRIGDGSFVTIATSTTDDDACNRSDVQSGHLAFDINKVNANRQKSVAPPPCAAVASAAQKLSGYHQDRTLPPHSRSVTTGAINAHDAQPKDQRRGIDTSTHGITHKAPHCEDSREELSAHTPPMHTRRKLLAGTVAVKKNRVTMRPMQASGFTSVMGINSEHSALSVSSEHEVYEGHHHRHDDVATDKKDCGALTATQLPSDKAEDASMLAAAVVPGTMLPAVSHAGVNFDSVVASASSAQSAAEHVGSVSLVGHAAEPSGRDVSGCARRSEPSPSPAFVGIFGGAAADDMGQWLLSANTQRTNSDGVVSFVRSRASSERTIFGHGPTRKPSLTTPPSHVSVEEDTLRGETLR